MNIPSGQRPPGDELMAKYGAELFQDPPCMTVSRLKERLAQWDALDQHFTKISLDYAAGMERRKVLDERTRWLVQIGQFTATRSLGYLEDTLRAALQGGLPAREALEAVLLCSIYVGIAPVAPALDIFTRVASDIGVLAGLRESQLPLNAHESQRSLEAERKTWTPEEESDPRREPLMQKYGWQGISTGLKYRGRHHLRLMEHHNALDSQWAGIWLKFTYQGMYSRWVLDDKTRVLCTVADCVAAGDAGNARDHMIESLRLGSTARELMEVAFLTGVYFGMPRMGVAMRLLEEIMREQGRIAELGSPPQPPTPGQKK